MDVLECRICIMRANTLTNIRMQSFMGLQGNDIGTLQPNDWKKKFRASSTVSAVADHLHQNQAKHPANFPPK